MLLFVCNWQDLNVDEFEEMFKTKAQGPSVDMTMSKQKAPQKGPSKVSLLEANRAKNLAITLRKAGKSPEEICKAIQSCVYTSCTALPFSVVYWLKLKCVKNAK